MSWKNWSGRKRSIRISSFDRIDTIKYLCHSARKVPSKRFFIGVCIRELSRLHNGLPWSMYNAL